MKKKEMPQRIRKRDGSIMEFDSGNIRSAVNVMDDREEADGIASRAAPL